MHLCHLSASQQKKKKSRTESAPKGWYLGLPLLPQFCRLCFFSNSDIWRPQSAATHLLCISLSKPKPERWFDSMVDIVIGRYLHGCNNCVCLGRLSPIHVIYIYIYLWIYQYYIHVYIPEKGWSIPTKQPATDRPGGIWWHRASKCRPFGIWPINCWCLAAAPLIGACASSWREMEPVNLHLGFRMDSEGLYTSRAQTYAPGRTRESLDSSWFHNNTSMHWQRVTLASTVPGLSTHS